MIQQQYKSSAMFQMNTRPEASTKRCKGGNSRQLAAGPQHVVYLLLMSYTTDSKTARIAHCYHQTKLRTYVPGNQYTRAYGY